MLYIAMKHTISSWPSEDAATDTIRYFSWDTILYFSWDTIRYFSWERYYSMGSTDENAISIF